MIRGSSRVGRRGSLEQPPEAKPDARTHLESFRSSRRLSEGASGEFRRLLRKDSKHLPIWNRTKRENRSSQTYISCLIDDMIWALTFMEAPTDWKHVEEMAVFIHETQSASSRGFHNVEHAFEVTGGASPVQMIAAFFRDTVVHYMDGGMNPKQNELLEGVFIPNTYELSPEFLEDELFKMVTELFGIRTSESLEHQHDLDRGMDILLSAIIVVKFLRDCVPKWQLAQIIVCMERTIPFRAQDDMGRSASDDLFNRLVDVNQSFKLGMPEPELEMTCQMATDLSNRIMGIYAAPDPDRFIAQTWGLLPELYSALRQNSLYSLKEFYYAVWDMHRFVESVDPSIYDTFRGIPQEAEIIDFQKAFVKNQQVGTTYLKLKTVEVATLTALAILTGGADIPKSMFYGDMGLHEMSALGDTLPQLDPREVGRRGCYVEVYDMMYKPRTMECCFDQTNAPVAAYIYGQIGEQALKLVFEKCVHPLTAEGSWDLLELLPFEVVDTIAKEIGHVAPSRADRLEEMLAELKNNGGLSRMASWNEPMRRPTRFTSS
jgi:hypothetical protein